MPVRAQRWRPVVCCFRRSILMTRLDHPRGDLAHSTQLDQTGAVHTVTMRERRSLARRTAGDSSGCGVHYWPDQKPGSNVAAAHQLARYRCARSAKMSYNSNSPAVTQSFINALTFPVLPQHVLSQVPASSLRESTFSQAPVGSGPFRFNNLQSADRLQKDKAIQLASNADYYRGRTKLNRF